MSQNEPYDPTPSTPQPGAPDNPIDDFSRPSEPAAPVVPAEPRPYDAPNTPSARPSGRSNHDGTLVWGIILIGAGIIFLLERTGIFHLYNWWALFILLPAIGAFRTAYSTYKSAGDRLTGAARGSLLGGLLLSALALIFLFGFNFGTLWPLLLIIAGGAMLLNALLPS